MNTILRAIDEEGNDFRISVDLSLFHIEDEGDCRILIGKVDPTLQYSVLDDFMKLHMLSNGFNITALN